MKPVLELIRLEENEKYGTFGVLKINKEVFCVTLELPDRLNRSNQSLIPAQQYTCKKVNSRTHGVTFEVMNVPGRTGILFHPGNSVKDTEGCILLGGCFGKFNHGDRVILNSGKTFKKFMKKLGSYDELHLTIKEEY